MLFFSRIVFICNVSFILAVIIWLFESSMRVQGNFNGAIKFQPLEATIVILGYGAIVLNAVFVLFAVYWLMTKRSKSIPRWILLFNLLIFPVQVWYHFILH